MSPEGRPKALDGVSGKLWAVTPEKVAEAVARLVEAGSSPSSRNNAPSEWLRRSRSSAASRALIAFSPTCCARKQA